MCRCTFIVIHKYKIYGFSSPIKTGKFYAVQYVIFHFVNFITFAIHGSKVQAFFSWRVHLLALQGYYLLLAPQNIRPPNDEKILLNNFATMFKSVVQWIQLLHKGQINLATVNAENMYSTSPNDLQHKWLTLHTSKTWPWHENATCINILLKFIATSLAL